MLLPRSLNALLPQNRICDYSNVIGYSVFLTKMPNWKLKTAVQHVISWLPKATTGTGCYRST